jgi:hypothetical protein
MSAFAPSQHAPQGQKEMSVPKLTQEELEKLQEIHELINLMLKELTVLPNAAGSYAVSLAQAFPYAYSAYSSPWGNLNGPAASPVF